jgi:hypothetical protein
VLYLDAQIAHDPRVSRDPVSEFDYEALAANGTYHGWDWTSFSYPDENGFHIRIRTVPGGFHSEFCGDTVHPSPEASHEALTAPLREAAARPAP